MLIVACWGTGCWPVCWSHCLQAACLSGQLDTWLHCDAGCRRAIQTTRHWSVSLLILCTLIIVLEANLGLKVPPDQIFMTLALALGTIAVASKAQILVGLESWEFFVSWYRVKFSDDIVVEFRGPFAGSARPVCRLWVGQETSHVSLSFPLARRLLSRNGSSQLVCSMPSYMAQHFVHVCNWSQRYHCQCYDIVVLRSPRRYRRSQSYDSGPRSWPSVGLESCIGNFKLKSWQLLLNWG